MDDDYEILPLDDDDVLSPYDFDDDDDDFDDSFGLPVIVW